ncbi:GNAT family N-acetyltransferase [Isoptericola sp. NPDC055881]
MGARLLSNLPAELTDGNLRLDALTPDTPVEPLFAALDERVWEHVPGGRATDSGELRARLVRKLLADPPCRTWLVLLDGEVVGTTSHFADPVDPVVLEIGATYMAPATWGTGLNARVKALMISAAASAGAARLAFQTDERNERSARAIRKLGARPVGSRLEAVLRPDGTPRTSLLFQLDLEG